MPEETTVTVQTSEATAAQDGVTGAVETNEDNASDASFSDTGDNSDVAGSENNTGKPETETRPAQSKEQNSEYARRRREAERQKELKELREKTIIETLGGKNPYTGGEVKDSADVEEYLTMREIEKNGGDPVADFAKHLKENARRTAQKQESDEKTAEWYRKDGEDFAKRFPEVKLEELISSSAFQDYADGKVGRRPLAEIYEGYLKHFGGKSQSQKNTEQQARDMAAQMVANRKAAVGSLTGGAAAANEFFTEAEVDKMSVAECEKNYDKIIKSMPHWKK